MQQYEDPKYTGRRGNKPLTETQRKEKRGRGRPANEPLPESPGLVVDAYLPQPPDTLSQDAQKEWSRVGEYLLLIGSVSRLDTQALAAYCASYIMFADSMRPLVIGRQPIWGEVNDKPQPSKLASVAYEHGLIVLEMARKFGMTARTRHLDHAEGVGRPATPRQILGLKLSRKFDRHETLPEWSPESVAMPGWFDPISAKEWKNLVRSLAANDLWTPLDVGPVAVLCASVSLITRCIQDLACEPMTLSIGGTKAGVEHPLSQVYRKQLALCESIWRDYGMTPYDRKKFVHVDGQLQGKPKLGVYLGDVS